MTDSLRHATVRAESGVQPSNDLTFFGIVATLLRRRRTVVLVTLLGIAIGTVVLLLKPRTYTTVFSFIPQSSQDPTKAGLAGLAGQFGVTLSTGGAQPQSPQMYADLLETREVLAPIADAAFPLDSASKAPTPLATALEAVDASPARTREKTLRYLRERVISSAVATRTTGVVTVLVKTEHPRLSYSIAERLLSGLNQFNLVTRQSQASAERKFTEGRLSAARTTLRSNEEALEAFLKTNRQYSNSPELTFAQDRLQREVSLQQQIVASLAQQYEEARIREVRDIPVITVIERPIEAVQPDPRGGLFILGGASLIGLLLGVSIALLSEEFARARREQTVPELRELQDEWSRARRVHS